MPVAFCIELMDNAEGSLSVNLQLKFFSQACAVEELLAKSAVCCARLMNLTKWARASSAPKRIILHFGDV